MKSSIKMTKVLTILFVMLLMLMGGAMDALGAEAGATAMTAAQWQAHGDRLAAGGRYEEALSAFEKAESLGGENDQLIIAKGDTLKALGRKREAYEEFAKLASSSNADNRQTGCEQENYLAAYRQKFLPDPWFADIYAQLGWQSIEDTFYADIKARLGVNMLPEERLQLYALLQLVRDNSSGIVGGFPKEVFDNMARLSMGVQARIFQEFPLYFLAEAGMARDLIDIGRDRTREDYRAGLTYYDEWYTNRECVGGVRYPFRFILSASAESMYYSRYDDAIISSIDIRPGIRLMESDHSSLDASLVLAVRTNNKADHFVEYRQLGGVLTWVPDSRNDLKVVLEAVNTYFPGGDDDFGVSLYLVYSGIF